MIRQGLVSLAAGVLIGFSPAGLFAAATDNAPDFKEVYDLLHEHLAGANDAELNRAAVQGLVSALGSKVSLVTNQPDSKASLQNDPLTRSNLYDGDIAYFRVKNVNEGLAEALRGAYDRLGATNKLKGLVIDLRYSRGDDYAAAAAAADLFTKRERPLLNWGNGMVQSKEKTDAISVPLVTLVNHQTEGAPEALAAVLRELGASLILGSQTAGQAMIAQEFPLRNGQRLRIATAPIQLGDTTSLTGQGVKPDITVAVGREEERGYFADAFKVTSAAERNGAGALSVTNKADGSIRTNRRPRLNEAELVRERRDAATAEGDSLDKRGDEPEKPVVRDPVLARALDILKGLAVVRQSRS
jgi:hypothetical protein